jgi:hypothetical protein
MVTTVPMTLSPRARPPVRAAAMAFSVGLGDNRHRRGSRRSQQQSFN